MPELHLFGLDSATIERIRAVFAGFLHLESAILYGSRAKGNFGPGSDIDLTLLGDRLSHADLLAIERALDELSLPYKFDLSLFRQIDNAELVDHIRRLGVAFYVRPV